MKSAFNINISGRKLRPGLYYKETDLEGGQCEERQEHGAAEGP